MRSGALPPEEETDRRVRPAWTLLTHDRLLGQRLKVQAQVRIVLAGIIVAGAIFARFVVGIEDLAWRSLCLLGAAVALYDIVANRIAVANARADRTGEKAALRRTMYLAIVLDYLALAVAIWLVGGARSPFLPFFLLHAILSCLLLSRRAAIALHFLAYGLLVLLVALEITGVAHPEHPAGAVSGRGPLDLRYGLTVVVVYGVLFLVTAWMLLGFARMLRRSERRIRSANEELSRISRMRRDFLGIALHNLQAPVGVVTMLLDNLKTGLGGPVTDKQTEWVDRCLARLGDLSSFMHDLKMLSTLESGKIEARAVDVDLAALLDEVVGAHRELAEEKDHQMTLDVPEELPKIRGIEVLLREAVANYVTNAIKYTPPGGKIVVRARSTPPTVRIEVEDNGVGIPEEEQSRLFREFVRLRPAGAKADGSGLGLSIVRRVAESHGGWTWLVSRPDQGSRFVLELPVGREFRPTGASNESD